MSQTVTDRLDQLLPPTGSREWWVVYVAGPIILFVIGLVSFPHWVYDHYIWEFLWGPVVADATGEPVIHEGLQAVQGYNPVNTVTYLAIVLYVLPGVREFFATFELNLNSALAYGLAPILVAGGIMRALEDAGVLPVPLSTLFITPTIYFVIAAITVVTIATGVLLRERFDTPQAVPLTVGSLGAVWSLVGFALVLSYGTRSDVVLRPLVLVAAIGIALGFLGFFYGVGRWLDRPVLGHPMVLLLVFGQMLDAAQNLIGVTFFGYTPKLFITRVVYEATNFSGSTFLLKFGAVALIVWFVTTSEEDVEATWNWLILFAATAVGLPQGVRGALRIVLGV
jgi:uncharacterized membrane protein